MDELENKIKHCEVDVPLNPTNKIDEGSAALVFKFNVRSKDAAVKSLKQQLTKRKVLRIATRLRTLKHVNVVRFRGYCVRPTAFIFELCYVVI